MTLSELSEILRIEQAHPKADHIPARTPESLRAEACRVYNIEPSAANKPMLTTEERKLKAREQKRRSREQWGRRAAEAGRFRVKFGK